MSAPLNLARRPLRNERLPTLLLAVGCVLLGVLSVRHAVLAYEIREGGAKDVAADVSALERELGRLRAEEASLRRVSAPKDKIAEWTVLKQLVDRRVFSWTGLFSALEGVLPPNVRLESVAPARGEGPLFVTVSAVARGFADEMAFVKALQASPQFEGAFPDGGTETADGLQFTCTVRYLGAGRPASGPPAGSPR